MRHICGAATYLDKGYLCQPLLRIIFRYYCEKGMLHVWVCICISALTSTFQWGPELLSTNTFRKDIHTHAENNNSDFFCGKNMSFLPSLPSFKRICKTSIDCMADFVCETVLIRRKGSHVHIRDFSHKQFAFTCLGEGAECIWIWSFFTWSIYPELFSLKDRLNIRQLWWLHLNWCFASEWECIHAVQEVTSLFLANLQDSITV